LNLVKDGTQGPEFKPKEVVTKELPQKEAIFKKEAATPARCIEILNWHVGTVGIKGNGREPSHYW
jgi:hypothetical protein